MQIQSMHLLNMNILRSVSASEVIVSHRCHMKFLISSKEIKCDNRVSA